MSKYMFAVSYTIQGVKGLLEGGGTAREKAVGELVKSLGGETKHKLHAARRLVDAKQWYGVDGCDGITPPICPGSPSP